MAPDPVRELLGQRRLGVGVARCAEGVDEQLDGRLLAGQPVGEARRLPRVVDEALLARPVHLSHRQPSATQPGAVDLAELGIPVPVGILLQVLDVQELEGDAGLAPLGVQVGTVGLCPRCAWTCGRRAVVERSVERRIGHPVDRCPVEAGVSRAPFARVDRPDAPAGAGGHGAHRAPQRPPLPQDLSCRSHGQSLRRHPPSSWLEERLVCPRVDRASGSPLLGRGGLPRRVHDDRSTRSRSRSRRSRWPDLGVHDAPIFVFTMDRRQQSTSTSRRC